MDSRNSANVWTHDCDLLHKSIKGRSAKVMKKHMGLSLGETRHKLSRLLSRWSYIQCAKFPQEAVKACCQPGSFLETQYPGCLMRAVHIDKTEDMEPKNLSNTLI